MRFFAIFIILFSLRLHAEAKKIEFWHSMTGEKGRLLQSIVDEFNVQARVKVESQFVGSYDEGLNKLRTALLASRGPHVVQITDIGQAVMIDSESIVPLHVFTDQDPDFPMTEILPAIRRYYEVNGKMYSLPFATSNPILYYNADMFREAGIEKAPATFAELEVAARKLTKPLEKIRGITWPLHSWFLEEFMARQGALLITPENGRAGPAREANYLSQESIAFIELWAKMNSDGTFANVGRGWDPAEQNFLAGRTAMLITSTSDILEVAKQVKFKLGTAAIPTRDLNVPGGVVVGGNSLWIMKGSSQDQAAAYAFVKFMASANVQKRWHMNTGYFPIRKDVIETLKAEGFYEKYPVAWTAIEQMRSSPEMPATRGALTPVFPEAREHMMNAIEEVLSGRATVTEAMTKAKAKTDFVLLRDLKSSKH